MAKNTTGKKPDRSEDKKSFYDKARDRGAALRKRHDTTMSDTDAQRASYKMDPITGKIRPEFRPGKFTSGPVGGFSSAGAAFEHEIDRVDRLPIADKLVSQGNISEETYANIAQNKKNIRDAAVLKRKSDKERRVKNLETAESKYTARANAYAESARKSFGFTESGEALIDKLGKGYQNDPWEEYKNRQRQIISEAQAKYDQSDPKGRSGSRPDMPSYLKEMGPEPVKPGPIGALGPISVYDHGKLMASRAEQQSKWSAWNSERNRRKAEETKAKADWLMHGGSALTQRARLQGLMQQMIVDNQNRATFAAMERVRLNGGNKQVQPPTPTPTPTPTPNSDSDVDVDVSFGHKVTRR